MFSCTPRYNKNEHKNTKYYNESFPAQFEFCITFYKHTIFICLLEFEGNID